MRYPGQTIKFIVPSPPGGGPDFVGRLVAQTLSPKLGQAIYVDNVAGASMQVGTQQVARAAPDGYTLLFTPPTPITIADNFEPRPPYNARRDLVPIALIGRNPALVVVNSSVKANTMREFIALAKAEPGKFNFGSPGLGNSLHLSTEMLCQQAGIKLTHIPYKGSGPAVIGLIGGDVQLLVQSAEAVREHVKSGRLRALATLETTRLEAFPNVPTLEEVGLRNLKVMNWYGVFAPAATPPNLVQFWEKELLALPKNAAFAKQMRDMSFDPVAFSGHDFAQMMEVERVQWADIIKSANITTNKA
jgi:tripartite-type tricarboxylate transporter receptor subunit TctC